MAITGKHPGLLRDSVEWIEQSLLGSEDVVKTVIPFVGINERSAEAGWQKAVDIGLEIKQTAGRTAHLIHNTLWQPQRWLLLRHVSSFKLRNLRRERLHLRL